MPCFGTISRPSIRPADLALLAHCLSFGINALHEKVNPYGAGISASGLTRRMAQSEIVAQAVDLDMVAAGWEPTADNYPEPGSQGAYP